MRLTKIGLYCFLTLTFFCPFFAKTAESAQERTEQQIKVKSKDLRGLSKEINDLLSGNNNYTASQKTKYRIDLTLAINKHVARDPYKSSVLLIQLTQNSGAADGESISPSLNEIFLKYPVPAIRAILESPNYLLKSFNNEQYIESLYTEVIQFPFYYFEDKKPEDHSSIIQKEKERLKTLINNSNLAKPIKNKVINHINQMHL